MRGVDSRRRVVVTGIGIVGPTGVGWQAFWDALLQGRSGIGRVTRFEASGYACQVAGEVRDLGYEALIDPRKLRTTTHATRLAMAAAQLALQDARVPEGLCPPEKFGVCLGTALGGLRDAEQQYGILLERGARRINPFVANAAPNHSTAAELAALAGAQGPQLTLSTGCPASLQAIAEGAELVRAGELDACLAGGTESPIIPLVFAGMARTRELSTINERPEAASRPFDAGHAGIVLSEGSCVLVLEPLEQALGRGAEPYAELLGAAVSCDAHGLFEFDKSCAAAARAAHAALERSNRNPGDIDYVAAHANASPAFDLKETLVLKKAFGERARRLAVSSIKGVLGHPFGAAGAFQTAAACLAIRYAVIPPTHNLESPADGCDLDYVACEPRPQRVRNALVTSYGYGGLNSYLVLSQL